MINNSDGAQSRGDGWMAKLEGWMGEALIEAQQAYQLGEVPVGAVIVVDDKIIARAHNLTENNKDPTAHAEMLAIRAAAMAIGNWRLNEAFLCVTVEPCTMCLGAILQARIATVVFGCKEPRSGALGSCYDLAMSEAGDRKLRVIEQVREQECRELMTRFFAGRRATSSPKPDVY